MVLNHTAIGTTGGVVASYTALALDVAGFLLIAGAVASALGRKKRHAAPAGTLADQQQFIQEAIYKVLGDLDEAKCSALALCESSSIRPEMRTPGHVAVIEFLSPQPGAPVSWTDINKPGAIYQYAAFIGMWAGLTSTTDQCRLAFPTCPLSSDDIITALTNKHVPCGSPFESKNKVEK